nr:Transposase InsD for insertion element IS2 [Escherichia coli]
MVNAKRVYRIMRTHNLLERKPDPCRNGPIRGAADRESNQRWCSMALSSAVIMAKLGDLRAGLLRQGDH